ncbi:MAG: hypothetical protein ACHQX0_06190 [Desulfobaccales bacterium]
MTFLAMWAAVALTAAVDVGLVTGLTGEVSYWNEAEKEQPARAEAFMKVRQGDRFKLSENGVLKVLYFNTGRQETWKGPRLLTAGAGASQAEGGGEPAVEMVSVKVARQMGTAPLPLPRSSLQYAGVIRTMGGDRQPPSGGPAPRSGSRDEAKREIAEAHKVYQEWRHRAEAADYAPEMYLLGILAENGQYREMDRLLTKMLGQKSGDPVLKGLQTWVRTQVAPKPERPPTTQGRD